MEDLFEQLGKAFKPEKIKSKTDIRYFFVSTVGTEKNGSHTFNTFDIQSTSGHPTIAKILQKSKELRKDQIKVMLLSVCEINSDDWDVFVSEQKDSSDDTIDRNKKLPDDEKWD